MGRVLILNGSPRAPRSNSKSYAEYFASSWEGEAEYCEIRADNHLALCGKLDGVSDVLLVFPLYADAIPVTLLNFLKFLEAHPPRSHPAVSVLINCGFLEPRQNEVAVRMVHLFCRKNQYPIGSVLKIGSGEAIWNSPFRFLAERKIRMLAKAIGQGRHQTLHITMPLMKRLFARAAASYWEDYGKRFGTTKEQMQTMEIE